MARIRTTTMTMQIDRHATLDAVVAQLELTDELTPALWDEAIASACARGAAMDASPIVARMRQFAADGAWVDAVFALIRVELPGWKLRRAVCEDGEWHCALSRAPQTPEWLDDAVEARHGNLAIALLMAAIDALHETAEQRSALPARIRSVRDDTQYLCCDNF